MCAVLQTAAIPSTNKLAVDMSQLVDSALSLRPALSARSAAVEVTANSLDNLQSIRSFAHDSCLPVTASAAVDSSGTRCITQQPCDAHPTSSNSTAEACSVATAGLPPAAQLGKNASSNSIGGKRVQKPAWALTANAAKDVEQEEEEELLAFAGGLEFDKYIAAQEDAELQDVLQVKGVPTTSLVQTISSITVVQPKLHEMCVGKLDMPRQV